MPRSKSRSRSPGTSRNRRRRSRSRDRRKRRDRDRSRDRSSDRRRSRSPNDRKAEREKNWDEEREKRKREIQQESLRMVTTSEIPSEHLEGKTPDEIEMMRVMGFSGFTTTKGKKVEGNNTGEVHVVLKRKYRQYMNRKGGFNRPLDFVH
ncbi:U4/U6.U5 small nuclear ribonucleoprotein 27 kDa protein-like [Tigriopus californicus]|uniref:U4/U6.U5 small nuclear ribonucleoprotein 27 kDa protein-like n=1 Tax=Tigriopus californicus TaxID=6832 RepID=UPI0027DA61CF|nr:U4/U6.U5 small nuclear ribonucleoprotein 27 kDa protein-like [Tigriopus californicus]